MAEKFKASLIKEILINEKINRFETGDKVLILDGVKFLVVTDEYIKSNHKPKGLYIEANSVLDYIQKNLFGHDKRKFGITEDVKDIGE